MNPGGSDSQFNNNTHNATPNVLKRRLYCANKRPCHRDSCAYCWHRRLKFHLQQVGVIGPSWQLKQFATISVEDCFDHPMHALRGLAKIRPRVARSLRKFGRYIMVIAVAPSSGHAYPHFHLLMTTTSKALLQDELSTWMPVKFNLHTTFVREGGSPAHLRRTLAYMLRKNLHPTLPFRPRGLRLLTASRGFFTGRPRYSSENETFYEG